MKIYKCGVFTYNFPDSSCAFCRHAEVFWDYTNGIYMCLCEKDHKIESLGKFAEGCNDKEDVNDK